MEVKSFQSKAFVSMNHVVKNGVCKHKSCFKEWLLYVNHVSMDFISMNYILKNGFYMIKHVLKNGICKLETCLKNGFR